MFIKLQKSWHEKYYVYCITIAHIMLLTVATLLTMFIVSFVFQWRVPVGVMLVYRCVLAVYTSFWLIYSCQNSFILMNGINISVLAFLTTWTYIVLTLYLVLHFLSCAFFCCKADVRVWKRLSTENHRRLFGELRIEPSLWAHEEYEYVPGNEDQEMNEVTVVRPPNMPNILEKVVWMLFNVASSGCLLVTIIFWTMLYPYMHGLSGYELLVNFQLHAVTSIIIVLEHILTAIPVRFLHFVYTLGYGLIYIAFSGILYSVDHRYVLYKNVLDWSKPGSTAVVCCITAFVALPLLQLVLHVVYWIKVRLLDRWIPEEL